MIKNFAKSLALLGCFAAGLCSQASAQDSGALLDALVKKGVLSDQEAEDIRADLTRDYATTSSAGKLDISSNITKLKIAGDARVRYQYDDEINNGSTVGSNDRARLRYRVRLGFTADLGPNWSSGLRFETANGATSTNADMGSGTDNFSKATTSDAAYLGQVFITYKKDNVLGADLVTADFGKFAHKYFTPGVNGFWIDSDINFEGFAQELVYDEAFGSGTKLALRSGQFVLNNNAGSTADSVVWPSFLHIEQVEVSMGKWKVAPSLAFFAAPADHDTGTFLSTAQQNDTTNYTDLLTVIVPAEYKFSIGDKPSSVYATYGYNLRGEDRAVRLARSLTADDDASMYNLGVKYGDPKLAGEYGLTAEYRYVGNGAYSSLLLDSDFNGGRLNGEGFILSGTYNWTAAVTSTITYFNSFNIDRTLTTNTNTSGQGFGSAQVVQIDLSAKF